LDDRAVSEMKNAEEDCGEHDADPGGEESPEEKLLGHRRDEYREDEEGEGKAFDSLGHLLLVIEAEGDSSEPDYDEDEDYGAEADRGIDRVAPEVSGDAHPCQGRFPVALPEEQHGDGEEPEVYGCRTHVDVGVVQGRAEAGLEELAAKH